MDFLARAPRETVSQACAADIRRIVAIWSETRQRFGSGGPFLFGAFTAADAMYAPVVSRFATYLPDLGAYGDQGAARVYTEAMRALPAWVQWRDGAEAEARELMS